MTNSCSFMESHNAFLTTAGYLYDLPFEGVETSKQLTVSDDKT